MVYPKGNRGKVPGECPGQVHDGYRELMVAILATEIKDYFKREEKIADAGNKRMAGYEKRKAEDYIFSDAKDDDANIFSFKNVCLYLGVDQENFRETIKSYKGRWSFRNRNRGWGRLPRR
jgi:hypothetical protein